VRPAQALTVRFSENTRAFVRLKSAANLFLEIAIE